MPEVVKGVYFFEGNWRTCRLEVKQQLSAQCVINVQPEFNASVVGTAEINR